MIQMRLGRRRSAPAAMTMAVALAAVLAACGTGTRRIPPRTGSAPATAACPAGRAFHLDGRDSTLEIRVRRAGLLAALGHDHVLVASDLRGALVLYGDGTGACGRLELPVEALLVDDDDARRAAGGPFAEPVSAADIAGTRRNLLGPQVLDAARYPLISVSYARPPGDGPVLAEVTVRGMTATLEVPVRVVQRGDALIAEGEFAVRQSTLGLEPFSVLGGALAVADELAVRFRFTARAD